MVDVTRRVNVIFQYFQKGLKNLSKNARGFNAVIGQTMEGFKKQNQANTSMITSGARLANRLRMLTHGMRGFRMEMLGIMFFGMGMAKFFKGLLSPATKLVGLFELWGLTLKILFLPTALDLLKVLMPLFTWLMDLSEPTKKLTGFFALFGLAIGTLLFLVGMFTLGIGSLILGWGLLIGVILPAVGIFVLIAAAVIGLVALWRNWNKITWQLKAAIGVLLAVFAGIAATLGAPFIAVILAIIGAIIGVMAVIKNWEKITTFFSKLWKSIFDALPAPVQTALTKIGEWISWLMDKLSPLLKGLKSIKRFFGGGIDVSGPQLADYLAETGDKRFTQPYGEFSRSDMRADIEEGMTAALDRAAFKNNTFISGLIANSEEILRQTGGTE